MPYLSSTNNIIKGQEWSVWVTEVCNWPAALNMAFTFLQCLGGDKEKSRHWRLKESRETCPPSSYFYEVWKAADPWRSHSVHYRNTLEAQLNVSTSFSLQLPLIWMKLILALAKGEKRRVFITHPSLNSQIWWLTGYHTSPRKKAWFLKPQKYTEKVQ